MSGARRTVCVGGLDVGNVCKSLRRFLLLEGAIIWCVEVGNGKKRLLDGTATAQTCTCRGEERKEPLDKTGGFSRVTP